MKDNQAKYPQLRFKGFTDPWEKRILGQTTTKAKSYSLSRDVERDHETGYRYIHYGDIHTGVADIVTEHTKLPNIEPANYDELRVNDLVVADASEDYQGIAEPAVVVGLPTQHLVAGLHTIALRPSSASSLYLYYLLHTESFKHFGYQTGTGLKVFGISWSNLSKFTFMIPSRPEQEKIVKLIESVDNLTSDNQRKLDKLKELKQGYLQKLFPENGSKFPQLRFAGFSDAWEQRKLGDFGKVAMNKRIFKAQTFDEGEIPFYKIGTFGGTPDAFISRKLFEEYKAKYPYPKIGDLLISASGSIGRTVEYKGEDAYFQDSNIVWLNHDDRLDNSFLKQLYSNVKWKGLEGSTIKRLYNKNILATEVKVPSIDEQKVIGQFLGKLDNIISLHQRKLEKLQELKKGYLQKMFC